MTKHKLFLISALALLPFLLSSCSNSINIGPSNNTDEYVTYKEHNTEIKPKNVIQIGDSFDFLMTKSKGTGHFSCTITDSRILTDESQLTLDSPSDLYEGGILAATVDDQVVGYPYEEWFTEGGAYDQGCYMVLIDLSVTNVDAEAFLDSGDPRGFFEDPYAFHASHFISLANLSRYTAVDGQYNFGNENNLYFDKRGDYCSEDILPTLGHEPSAIQILPGQTVTFTLGYGIPTNQEGNSYKLSDLMAVVGSDKNAETGIFIDLALGDD